MTIKERIEKEFIEAMKSKEQLKVSTLRMLKAAVKNREIEKGSDAGDADWLQVIQKLIKQRRDSVEQYEKGGRKDLADKERSEIAILEQYLPPAPSDEEIEKTVKEVIASVGASGPKDMGKVMKECMSRFSGSAVDGSKVSALVKKILSGN